MTDDEELDKAIGQFRLALNGIMKPLCLYGQDVYVASASEEIVSLAVQLHERLSGIDKPYFVNHNNLHY